MKYLPIELDVGDREVALIGDHPETRRKIPRLLAAGARVILFDGGSPVAEPPEGAEVRSGMPARLDDYLVVFVSPHLADEMASAAARARAAGRLFCVLDRPELSTFANPAIVETGEMGLRIFGGGAAPGLTRRLREDLERALDDRFGRFVEELARRRRAWPRGERPARTRQLIQGFALEVRVRLPSWFADIHSQGGMPPEGADNT